MKSVYSHTETDSNFGYEGILYEKEEIENTFPNQIRAKLIDSEGTNELASEFSNFDDLKSTGFDEEYLVNIFSLDDVITEHKDWRIGEAFAELHLEDCVGCRFYYNELRDARNVYGNKPGADLVGFVEIEDDTVFLFGEVKTSSEDKYPPQVLYSRHGMIDQLSDLAKNYKTRKMLVRYLASKVFNLDDSNPFKVDYFKALKNYLEHDKFGLFGVLIRDTESNDKDIKSRYKNLKNGISSTGLKMLALYIPVKMNDWNDLVGN